MGGGRVGPTEIFGGGCEPSGDRGVGLGGAVSLQLPCQQTRLPRRAPARLSSPSEALF